jgi:hypothetical protein
MKTSSTTLVAVKPCGCFAALLVETGTDARSIGTFYRDAGRDGCEVRRFPTAEIREVTWRCERHPRVSQPSLFGRKRGAA